MKKKENSLKTILVIGASRGIGFATVKQLASCNFKIYAGVRSKEFCSDLLTLAQENPNIIIQEIDLQKKSSIKKFAREIKKQEDKIDVIINSAGSIIFGPIETISQEDFYEQFQVNVFGPVLLVQEFIPLMRKNKEGHIIFLGSTSGVESHGMYGAYAASKFSLEAICHSLAVNLYPWNIKVSIVELSGTNTLIAEKTLKLGSQLKHNKNPYSAYIQNTLEYLRKILINGCSPQEIAKAIEVIISNPTPHLRHFATQKSQKIFENELKDPLNIKWEKEARESLNFYEKTTTEIL